MIRKSALVALFILAGVTLEVVVFGRIPLPGATPDLVAVIVVSLALAFGPRTGALAGFFGGLAIDIAPPADSPIGVSALVLSVAGLLVGLASDPGERSALASIGLAAGACAATLLVSAMVLGLVGSPRVAWADLGILLVTTAAYGAILSAFVIPLTLRVSRIGQPPVRI